MHIPRSPILFVFLDMGVQHVHDDHAEIASVWVGLKVTCSKITLIDNRRQYDSLWFLPVSEGIQTRNIKHPMFQNGLEWTGNLMEILLWGFLWKTFPDQLVKAWVKYESHLMYMLCGVVDCPLSVFVLFKLMSDGILTHHQHHEASLLSLSCV